jgi:hypothetical protein
LAALCVLLDHFVDLRNHFGQHHRRRHPLQDFTDGVAEQLGISQFPERSHAGSLALPGASL